MSYFDILQELKICAPTGRISGNFEEVIDGITCNNRLMQVLIMEDYDDPDAWEVIHQDKYQKEMIFKLLEHFALGGSLCQNDDNIAEYLNIVKLMYKDLVVVAKDHETGDIKCHSLAFKVELIDDKPVFAKNNDHNQNFFYVVVDPINCHVNFLHHSWVPHW
jgi:hypothetical protein